MKTVKKFLLFFFRNPKHHPLTRSQYREVEQWVAAGKRVNAIKCVRQHTGWGLKEAKCFVDDRFPWEIPDADW